MLVYNKDFWSKTMLVEVEGFDGRYTVDKLGNVYSMVQKGKIMETPVTTLKPADNKGYLKVVLKHKGCSKSHGRYVHRLVAQAFVPNPNGYTDVNHKDGNKQNNHYSNLEWCSRQQNIDHSWATGLSTNEMNKRGPLVKYVGTSVKDGTTIELISHEGLIEKGFDVSCVCRCCVGSRATHKGYKWTKIDLIKEV